MLSLSDFDYHLPQELIAQTPARPRDSARLMLINRTTADISHHHIYDLPTLIPPDYFVVANNTKVFPARLRGHKETGGKVEVLLISPLGESRYSCIAKPGLKLGDIIIFGQSLQGTIIAVSNNLERTIEFNQDEATLRTTLSEIGEMPTPPYIKKLLENIDDYQTIYAKYGFSAAAPTAGLHFTPELLNHIKKDHGWEELTLNVGLGTFLPVKEENIEEHHMHSESYTITQETAANILEHKSRGQKLLSVGTTTMRALESNPELKAGDGETSIFIYPPYKFALVGALMTNFHLPSSTLLMLVSAFCSYPNTQEKFTTFADSLLGRAYAKAIKENYRFFSFGDAMLII
jgi:S-adenosylmethionine:tRNA ribosyltransferase-isomerase